ncbi:interstitial collagenase-like [Diadema antillarum]|uniref:interstitial collagenase-like n=1 Tax=Diadema antillarum TaxID=105358 RepID=UPI003A8A23D7
MEPRTWLLLVVLAVLHPWSSSAPTGAQRRSKSGQRRSESSRASSPSPISYLEKYGYLVTGVQHSPTSLESAIRVFQEFAGLEQTGLLDEATQEKLSAKRCGVEDIVGTAGMGKQQDLRTNGTSRFRRYNTDGTKWSKTALTYYFKNYTPDLTRAQVRDAIRRAFQLWADVSPLTFSETSDRNADILIEFAAGVHSDGFAAAFDGPGGTLAHAYFPENGDAHFDEDETFTIGTDSGINLYIVAAHEFGHSLGLLHSSDMSALMYPWYLGYVEDYQLPRDDINGIQHLYGKPDVEKDPAGGRPDTGSGRGGNLPPCNSRWDSATYFEPDNVVYAFKDQYVWAIDNQGVVDGYPKKTRKVFPEAPSNIHAVVSSGRRTYMFKGNNIWRYYNKRLENGFPRKKSADLPKSPNAALQWGGNGKIYIFKGSRFYEFYEHDLTVGAPMKIAQQWKGVPTKIDAALQWRNGKTYFFRGNKYWRFNDAKLSVAKDYPRSKSKYWSGCGLSGTQDLPAKLQLRPEQQPTTIQTDGQ